MNYESLIDLVSGFKPARAVQTAVLLGVFDALIDGPASVIDLADRVGASERGVGRLVESLVAYDLLEFTAGGYELAPVARRYLVTSAPESCTNLVRWLAAGYETFVDLERCVCTGEPVDIVALGDRFPSDRATWIAALHQHSIAGSHAARIASWIDLSTASRLLDVGGGAGTYSLALCEAHPQLRATIFELPSTASLTKAFISERDRSRQIEVVEGDYLTDPLPGGFDVVLLSNVVHQHEEEANRLLVSRTFDALNPGGRVIVHGPHLDSDLTGPRDGVLLSLTLLVQGRGRSYAANEVAEWLREAGFGRVAFHGFGGREIGQVVEAVRPQA